MNDFTYPVIDPIKTGHNIKALREQSGMSVRELQYIMGFTSPQAIYKWQWGDTVPDLSNLLIMSKLFNVPIEDILITCG